MKKMFALLLLCAPLAGCKTIPPPEPLNQLNAQQQAGHRVFQADCAGCHYDRQSGSLHGPSLLDVYRKSYLPSGAPANDDRIRNTILHGRNNMPPLGGQISDGQIDNLLAYLKTL
jgi:mono/diheme cytochrome c family protein